jgi:hypothetical protein
MRHSRASGQSRMAFQNPGTPVAGAMLKNGHRGAFHCFFDCGVHDSKLAQPTPMPAKTRTGIHKTFTRASAYDSAKIVKLSPCFARLDDNLASTFIFLQRNKKSSGQVGSNVRLIRVSGWWRCSVVCVQKAEENCWK